ncbi:DUF2306 domain-containing protein [Sphingomonas lenta]|uniref:DUF2306 domain-containing protein n=1 Tax=Sphingomonas lenta TaxID=1141887 RepID=A0A2A2SCT9_9SPHN|nr:DUF2306 domain-containing protein [Sphingomonas lenta]PAX07068.1 hypothetical protein CKY28_13540 [Sphingomonas lenta]
MASITAKRAATSFWALTALLSVAVALFSYRYLTHASLGAPDILANTYARPWLSVHVAASATALLLGAFQFLPGLRSHRPALHRWTGRIYAVGCLIGGAAGLVIAFGSTAGPVATLGFGLLAVAWLVTTAQGWRLARARRYAEHRAWMIRSWSLTLAAVTLRLGLAGIALSGLPFRESYLAVSFLCWVPNLLAAELYLRSARRTRPLATASLRPA